jgi:DNA-binding NtrC family response regulator
MRPLLTQSRPGSSWPMPHPSAGARTILLLDCGTAINQLMRMALRETGHTILEAPSVGAALQLWATRVEVIDLIVADITLERDEAVQRLLELARSENPRLRVLFVSGPQGTPALPDAAYPKQLRTVVENCLG